MTEEAFWDASALVPLCMHESRSSSVLRLSRRFNQTVWWATSVEVRSAISRLHRVKEVDASARNEALDRLHLLTLGWEEVPPTEQLREQAYRLLDTHSLRAADSLQLAAALAWCHQDASGRSFVCADVKLNAAAEKEGFSIIQP